MAVEKINVPPAFRTLHLPKTGQRINIFFLGTFLYRDRRSVSLLTRLIHFFTADGRHKLYSDLLHTVCHGGVMLGLYCWYTVSRMKSTQL